MIGDVRCVQWLRRLARVANPLRDRCLREMAPATVGAAASLCSAVHGSTWE